MNRIIHITPHFAVTGAMQPEDFAAAAGLGFRAIVSNLPDGEMRSHPTSTEAAKLAADAGLGFFHIPAVKHEVFSDRVVDGMTAAMQQFDGPVLAHCASGVRSALAWAAAAARSQPADCVIATLAEAGFNVAAIRDELEAQRDGAPAAAIPLALDCRCGERAKAV
jgi:sulfide:quinone oxidoreductase